MTWNECHYENGAALAASVAARLAESAVTAIAGRGRALFALAGGSTPFPLYRYWASMTDTDFARVTVVPTDERCVPHDHPACNGRALVDAFARASGIDIRFLTPPDGDVDRAADHANAALADLDQPFDAVVLGMGLDGHVASLFPGAVQLAAALSDGAPAAMRVDPEPLPPEAPFARISLSGPRLRRSRSLHLVIAGQAKLDVLRHAQALSADWRTLPVAALLHDPTCLMHVHWSPT